MRLRRASMFLALAVLLAATPSAAQDPIALARAGTSALESGRFGDALDAFTRAAAIRPDESGLHFGAGVAAFMVGQDEAARSHFEHALALNPNSVPAAEWLGDIHYRAGRLADAIAIYEAARKRAPERRELQQRLADWRKQQELQSRFREVGSEHFTVQFEAATNEPLARRIINRLEAACARIGTALGVNACQPTTVLLYTRDQFTDVTGLSDWSVAAYDGRIRVPLGGALEQPEELDRVLSHELVHTVIARVGGRTVPAWVSEGLATVLEPAGSDEAAAQPGRTGARPPLAKLERGFANLSRRDAEAAYASAARAMRRLIDERGMPAVVALLQDLARGTPFDRAFLQRTAMRYDEFASLVARD